MPRSIQPEWCKELPLQQQSVLLLASRGPDGIPKSHVCKDVQRAYRACVLKGAKPGRELQSGEVGDSFMSLRLFHDTETWIKTVDRFYEEVDQLPHHYIMHLLHGAEILSYKHPQSLFRNRWMYFYRSGVTSLHLHWETQEEMDARLSDWNQEYWDEEPEMLPRCIMCGAVGCLKHFPPMPCGTTLPVMDTSDSVKGIKS